MKRQVRYKVKQAKKTLGRRQGQHKHDSPSAWVSEHLDNNADEAQWLLRKSSLNASYMGEGGRPFYVKK